MLKIFSYGCGSCGFEFDELVDGYVGHTACHHCGEQADKTISCPAIHTLETHFRGMRGDSAGEQFVPGHGGYRDHNLCDKNTGEPLVYNSLSEKRKLLKEQGLFEKGPSKERFHKRRSKRPMTFTAQGSRKSQLGMS